MGQLPHVDPPPSRCERCGRALYGGPGCGCGETTGAPTADEGAGEEVRGELAKWRRIREGAWVRKRVLTGDSGPLSPEAARGGSTRRPRHSRSPASTKATAGDGRDAAPRPRAAALEERAVPAPEVPRGHAVSHLDDHPVAERLSPSPLGIEDTSEVEGVPLELITEEPTLERASRLGGALLVALLFVVVAAGITWAISVLS